MVCVLPAPVAPYANTVALTPFITLSTICVARTLRLNTCSCVELGPNAASNAYS